MHGDARPHNQTLKVNPGIIIIIIVIIENKAAPLFAQSKTDPVLEVLFKSHVALGEKLNANPAAAVVLMQSDIDLQPYLVEGCVCSACVLSSFLHTEHAACHS